MPRQRAKFDQADVALAILWLRDVIRKANPDNPRPREPRRYEVAARVGVSETTLGDRLDQWGYESLADFIARNPALVEAVRDPMPPLTPEERGNILRAARAVYGLDLPEDDIPPAEELMAEWRRRGCPDPYTYLELLLEERQGHWSSR